MRSLLAILILLVPALRAQNLSFARTGKGPGLLLIHGFAGNQGVWAETAKALAAHFTVVTVDLPGSGASAAPAPGPVDFAALADAVAKVGRQELEGSYVVVAHSMGGLVGLRLASRHGESVRGLVLLDAPLLPMEGTQAETLARALEADPGEAFRARYGRFTSSPKQLERVVAEAAKVPGPVLADYTRGRTVSNEGDAARVRCPVLLIASPILLPQGFQPELEARAMGYGPFKILQVVRLAKVGHWVMWDEPKLVVQAIREYTANLEKR